MRSPLRRQRNTTADGDKIYKWTITYNELRLASAGGDTIKDTIAADSTEYMKYYGDGLSIKVIDKNGNTVDTRNVPYSALQSYSDSSWTYKIPEGDSQPYMYEITYYTVVDMEKVEGTGNTVTVSNTANGSSGSAGVTPESVISVDKSVESFTTEEVNWKITLGVPENGLTQAVVTDTLCRSQVFLMGSPTQWKPSAGDRSRSPFIRIPGREFRDSRRRRADIRSQSSLRHW